jgi:hypothetical protein
VLLLIPFLVALLAACGANVPPTPTRTPTLVPTSTPLPTLQPSPLPTLQDVPTDAPTLIPITVVPLYGKPVPPPIQITLPGGWKSGSDALVLKSEIYSAHPIPIAIYQGPITGGTGNIVVLWGYGSQASVDAVVNNDVNQQLWSDGLRLLRLAVFEQGCNIGTDLQRDYRIGTLPATGTQFAVVSCPSLPDTRGWFAGLRVQNTNFMFYVYADPIDAMKTGQDDLQTILDSVQFVFPEATATPTP